MRVERNLAFTRNERTFVGKASASRSVKKLPNRSSQSVLRRNRQAFLIEVLLH